MPQEFDTVLLIDDDEWELKSIATILKKHDYRVLTENSGNKGIAMFENDSVDIVIADLFMPDGDGFTVLKHIQDKSPDTPVIIISGYGKFNEAVKAINEGAYDYLEKGFSSDFLLHSVKRASERLKMIKNNESVRLELKGEVQKKTRQLEQANKNLRTARDRLINLNHELDKAMVDSRINEAKYRALINKSPIGIAVVNSDFGISEANPAFLQVFGFSSVEDLRKVDILTFPSFMDSGITSNLLMCMENAEECSFEQECPLGEVTNKCVKCYLTPIKTQNFFQDILLLIEDVTLRREAEKEIERQAKYCKISGLLNQSSFKPELEKKILNAQATQCNLALVFIDIDNFKQVNDSMGHPCGDELIADVGKRIQNSISDDVDSGFRVGGDEFAVIFTQYRTNSIRGIIERFLDQLNKPYTIGVDAEMKNITFSVGIAEYGGQSAEDLYEAADKATYHSKKAGKNTHTYYEPSMKMSETLPASE